MWKAFFIRDTENPDIGTVYATFDDGNGYVFATDQMRLDQKSGIDQFVAKAKAALAADQAKKAQANSIADKVTTALNA